MRTVFWTMAFGPAFVEMTGHWYGSLRGAGRYGGDVRVYTDAASVPGVPPDCLIHSPSVGGRAEAWAAKPRLGLSLVGTYDLAVMADADVTFVGPVGPLLVATDRLAAARGRWPACHPGNGGYDPRAQALRPPGGSHGRLGINSGVWACPARCRDDLLAWAEETAAVGTRASLGDQSVLNKRMLLGEVKVHLYPRDFVTYPVCGERPTPWTVAVHYAGLPDASRLAMMLRRATGPFGEKTAGEINSP